MKNYLNPKLTLSEQFGKRFKSKKKQNEIDQDGSTTERPLEDKKPDSHGFPMGPPKPSGGDDE